MSEVSASVDLPEAGMDALMQVQLIIHRPTLKRIIDAQSMIQVDEIRRLYVKIVFDFTHNRRLQPVKVLSAGEIIPEKLSCTWPIPGFILLVTESWVDRFVN